MSFIEVSCRLRPSTLLIFMGAQKGCEKQLRRRRSEAWVIDVIDVSGDISVMVVSDAIAVCDDIIVVVTVLAAIAVVVVAIADIIVVCAIVNLRLLLLLLLLLILCFGVWRLQPRARL